MMYVAGFLILVSSFAFNSSYAAEVSCECPKLACDPCSAEKGITFFTDKCGPANSKLKSCARPTCIPIETATKECPIPPMADSGPRAPIVVAPNGGEVKREAASGSNEIASVGKVKVLSGSVSIVNQEGKTRVVKGEGPVHEGDRVASDKDAAAVVSFEGGNKLHVQPDSEVEIKEYKNQGSPESRRALLNLIKGKVRNQVGQKYNGKSSYYKITTKGAVAGVRGTDFLVTFSEGVKLDTRIETLGGKVELSDLGEGEKRMVGKGEALSFIADVSASDANSVPIGRFGELYKMSDEEMKALDKGTRMDIARVKRKTASDEPICQKPRGDFNQCMWKCENNPEGSKSCRTEMSQVRCVRSRCNGNGEWAEVTRVPASSGETACPAAGTLVKDCDY
jgi:hypothetical protein